jgi:hypothetical protein
MKEHSSQALDQRLLPSEVKRTTITTLGHFSCCERKFVCNSASEQQVLMPCLPACGMMIPFLWHSIFVQVWYGGLVGWDLSGNKYFQ